MIYKLFFLILIFFPSVSNIEHYSTHSLIGLYFKASSQTSRCVFFRCLNSYGHLCLPGELYISDGISYLGDLEDLEEPNSKSKKCDVVETPTLDPWPSMYLWRIWLRSEPSFSLWKSETEKANSSRPSSPTPAPTPHVLCEKRPAVSWNIVLSITHTYLLQKCTYILHVKVWKIFFLFVFFAPTSRLIQKWSECKPANRSTELCSPTKQASRVFYLFNLSVKESRQESWRL